MKIDKVIKISIIFLIGFLSANLLGLYVAYGYEMPFSLNGLNINTSKKAPSDFINEEQIEVLPDKIIINIEGASLSRYAPTGSMKPVLDKGSNGIRVVPESEDEINIGDIISFEQDNYLIVHRVVDKGTDEKGVYFITKGDNSPVNDGKIRFKDIKYITVGVIW